MSATPLALKIAGSIAEMIRSGAIEKGEHLSTLKLAERFGVSRSPVREALKVLHGEGFVEQQRHRGFFVRMYEPADRPSVRSDVPFDPPSAYHRIANDWIADRIPGDVTEQMLRQRYGLSRARLNEVLVRAAREGWAQQKDGYGWQFLSVAKTPQAFEQIYRLRMTIEPAAMLEPTYAVDREVLEEQRRIQQRMLNNDITHVAGEQLLDYGAQFHEALIRFSGNPFFHQTLERLNRMRRLLEYRSRVNRDRLSAQCTEHLAILDLIERGEVFEASYAMRRHLSGALAAKSPVLHGRIEEPDEAAAKQ